MIFIELTLTNVGLYSGKQTFDLKPHSTDDNDRPIVLFGGKNGAGKTTILEAIRLCLYGREALGTRVEKANYERYLLGKIHRQPGESQRAKQARITLKFEHAHAGIIDVYTIERSWITASSEVHETLVVQKNGQYLPDIHTDIWQDFVKDLIPPGISQLFFFDGEKIQELAEDETGNMALAEAIKSTFGLNIVEYLKNDISIYRRREEADRAKQELRTKLVSLESKQEEINERLQIIQRKVEDAQIEYERLNKQLTRVQEDLDREGWLFTRQRDEIANTINNLEGEKKQVEKRIRDVEGLEPFAAIPELCLELREQLLQEERYTRWKVSQDLIAEYTRITLETISSPDFLQEVPELTQEASLRLTAKLKAKLEPIENTADFGQFRVLHDLSEKDRWQLLQYIEQILTIVPEKIQRDFTELEELHKRLEDANKQQSLAPEKEILQPLMEKRDLFLRKVVAQKQITDTYVQEQNELKLEKTMNAADIEHTLEEIRKDTGHQERLVLAGHMERVMERFYQSLLENRIQELESTFVRYFGQLSRKRNMVWKAKIDSKTFAVTLFTRDGRQLPKSTLSAGEKQIYAIALLWTLRDISGRPLPVVIDTPLGRLDSDHRQHIVENYFPFASHQVILLSTDTEIDNTYFAALEPAISHSYQLHYDQENMSTTVSEGYFWKVAPPQGDIVPLRRELPVLNGQNQQGKEGASLK